MIPSAPSIATSRVPGLSPFSSSTRCKDRETLAAAVGLPPAALT